VFSLDLVEKTLEAQLEKCTSTLHFKANIIYFSNYLFALSFLFELNFGHGQFSVPFF